MKKIITISMAVLAGISLAACSNDSSNKNTSSTSTASAGLNKADQQLQQSPAKKKTSSSLSSNKSTETLSDPKLIGVLAYQQVYNYTPSIEDQLYFGTNGSNCKGNNGQYIVSSGSPSGTISFSINGNQVIIYQMDASGDVSDAEASYKASSISLSELIDKYYKSDSQKSNVQAVAQAFKDANNTSEDDNSSDSSSDNDSDNDDNSDNDDSSSQDQPVDNEDNTDEDD